MMGTQSSLGSRETTLLESSLEKISLNISDKDAIVNILGMISKPENVGKVIGFTDKLDLLPPEFDISKLNQVLKPEGQVRMWMLAAVEKGDKNGLLLWKNLIRILGKNIHLPGEGTHLLNSLLQVVEKAFKHNNNDLRIAAYNAWMALMDNFALNHSTLISKKRVKLLVRPLIGSISNRTEEQVQLKFDTWWHYFGLLGHSLSDQVESVVIPFLQFCFSSTVPSQQVPQSPAKKYTSLRKKCLEATALLCCGLNMVKLTSLDISMFPKGALDHGVLNPEEFILHHTTLFHCAQDIFETIQVRSRLEMDQMTALMKTFGHLVDQVANSTSKHPNADAVISNYLQMIVSMTKTSKSDENIHALNLANFAHVAKIPDAVLGSIKHDKSPGLWMLEDMLKVDLLKYVFLNTEAGHKDKFLAYFTKFCRAACLSKQAQGLKVIHDILEKISILDTDLKAQVSSSIWKIVAQVYLAYVDKFGDVNGNLSLSSITPDLTASYNLLIFPLRNFLDLASKPTWKIWNQVFNKFNDKAPLLVAYKTLEAEEMIAKEALKVVQGQLSKTEWINLSSIYSQSLIQSVPFQSLSQESEGVVVPKVTDFNPLGKLHSIFEVLLMLLKQMPKLKDKSTSLCLMSQLHQVLSNVTMQSIQKPLLKLVCPIFPVILDKDLMYQLGYEFESKVKGVHEIIITRLKSRYEDKFDISLLEDLSPFIKASLTLKSHADIKNNTHQMWQLTFGSCLKAEEIPNEIKDLLKATEEPSNSEPLVADQSTFAVPNGNFSSIFSKMGGQEKSKNVENGTKKSKANHVSIDEENSQDFVKILSPGLNKKRPLTEHQKEILRQRKDDIPALYSELSRDDTESMSSLSMFQSQSLTGGNNEPESIVVEDKESMDKENTDQESVVDINKESEEVSERKSKRKGKKPQKLNDKVSPVKEVVKKKRGRPPKEKKTEEKQNEPINVSTITQQLKSKTQVHIDRMTTNHLEISKGSPVKVVKENPLVIEPAPEPMEDSQDVIGSSQPIENNEKKRKRHSIGGQPAKRPMRRAAQKLNLTVSEESSSIKASGKENEGPRIKIKLNKYGESQLHVAIKKGDFEKAKALVLDDKADVNMKDHAGWTPLHEAAARYGPNVIDMMELLLDNGADINARANNGSTPLHDAVKFLPDDCIRFMLVKGANPDIKDDDGRTAKSLISAEKRNIFEEPARVPKLKVKLTQPVEIVPNDPEPTNSKVQDVIPEIIAQDNIEANVTDNLEKMDEDNNELNDSSSSVLATPLDESMDEANDLKTVPSSQNEEQSEEVVEEPSTNLIKLPLPIIKEKIKQKPISNLGSRGARLLKMSKEKILSPANSTASSCSNSGNESPSQLLMSPRIAIVTTPTQPKREAWQKFVPSPCDASPSAGILKRSASLPTSTVELEASNDDLPPPKRRRVQFTDPPVSDQVVIPRCPSGKQTRQKLQESKFNREMFLSAVAKDLNKSDSLGLYESTPPLESANDDIPTNCIYPSLNECDEPVTSILHNLTNKTWHKAAEKSLKDNGIETIGDLSRLTALKASNLKSLRPPNNVATIKEALRKFEKSWIKRGKDKYTERKVLNSPTSLEHDFEDEEIKEQSPTAAPVLHQQSTPEEEDEAMKEIYERPSPSPTESIEILGKSEHKELVDANIETDQKSFNEIGIETDKTDIANVSTSTDVAQVISVHQQTESKSRKEKLDEVLKSLPDFEVEDLTAIIRAAADAINLKHVN